MAYTNIVSQPMTAVTEFDEALFSYGETNFYEGVTYHPVEFAEDYHLQDGSYGIDAGTTSFTFDEIEAWSQNWPYEDYVIHEYLYSENNDPYNGNNPDIGFIESEFEGIEGCLDPIALNYNVNATFGYCEYYNGPVWYVSADAESEGNEGYNGTQENLF